MNPSHELFKKQWIDIIDWAFGRSIEERESLRRSQNQTRGELSGVEEAIEGQPMHRHRIDSQSGLEAKLDNEQYCNDMQEEG